MRPVIALLLALLILIPGQLQPRAWASSAYDEVPLDHWSYAALDYLSKIGVLEGYPEDFFNSDRTLTRYEFAQGIARAEDCIDTRIDADGKLSDGDWEYPPHVYFMVNDLHEEYSDQLCDLTRVYGPLSSQEE